MKLNFIIVILLFGASNFTYSQTEELVESSNALTEQNISTTIEGPELARNPAMNLIEKNGGLVFAEVTLKGNLIHVFRGKANDSEFDIAFNRLKSSSYIKSFEKINTGEYQVEFNHNVTDSEQRLFYEELGYSGYSIKTN